MRKLIVLGALALAACSGNAPTNNSAVSEADAGGEVTAVNDTTAIDAATGEAANMAADVNYSVSNVPDNESGNRTSERKPGNRPPAHERDEPGVVLNNSDG